MGQSEPPPTPPRRPWYRPHRSTWFALLPAIFLVVIVEVPGTPCRFQFLHGWPWPYLVRASSEWDSTIAPWLIPRAWHFTQQRRFVPYHRSQLGVGFSLASLVGDICVSAAFLFIFAAAVEWRRRRRTRWHQFTLRELFVLTLVVASILSWWRMHHLRRARECAVAELYPMSAFSDGPPLILRKLFPETWLDDFVANDGFVNFDDLDDNDICKIAELRELTYLNINAPGVTDEGMKAVATLVKLRDLSIDNSKITNRSVAGLAACPALESLSLRGAAIDDEAVAVFARLPRLHDLDIHGTGVGRRSLPVLTTMTGLRSLNISRTNISRNGFYELLKQLPNCKIVYIDPLDP